MKSRPRNKRKTLLRTSVRLVVAIVLLGLIGGVVLYFIPFSFRFLDRRVQTAFNDATDLDLRFEALVFYLAQRRIVLRDVEIVDPKDGESLTGAEKIELDWSPGQGIKIDWMHFRGLRIENPAPLQFHFDNGRLKPGRSLARLLESGSKDNENPTNGGWSVDALALRGATIDITDGREGPFLAQLSHAEVIGGWTAPTNFDLRFEGRLQMATDPDSHSWSGRFSTLPDGSGQKFFSQIDSLDARNQNWIDLPLGASGRNISLRGEIRPASDEEGAEVGLDLHLAADDLDLHNRTNGLSLHAQNLEVDLRGVFSTATKRFLFESFKADALDFHAAGAGWIDLATPYDYKMGIVEMRAPEAALLALQNFAPETKEVVTLERGSLTASGRVQGALSKPYPDLVQFRLQIENVDARFRNMPWPLEDLSGELTFDGKTLVAENVRGRLLRNRLEIGGSVGVELQDSLLHPRLGKLDLEWWLKGEGEDLLGLAAWLRPEIVEGLEISGAIESRGVLKGDLSSTTSLAAAVRGLEEVSGELTLTDCRVSHPKLPAPIESINGSIAVERGALWFSGLKGSMLGSTVELTTGTVRGSPDFWDAPHANVRIVSDLDLGALRSALEKNLDKKPPPFSGRASVRLDFEGPLRSPERIKKDPKTIEVSGAIDLHGASVTLDEDALSGQIRDATGRISFRRGRLDFDDVKFKIRNVSYFVDGKMTRADIEGKFRIKGPFKEIDAAHPTAFEQFTVGGDIDMDIKKVHLGFTGAERKIALADKSYFPFAGFGKGAKAVRKRSFDAFQSGTRLILELDGTATVKDVEMTYLTLPAKVWKINGVIDLDEKGVYAESLPVHLGDYPAIGTGDYLFEVPSPSHVYNGHRQFNYTVRADVMDMKPWYGRWKPPPPEFAYTPLKPGQPTFIKNTTQATVHIKKALMGQFEFENHYARFYFENRKGPLNYLHLMELTVEAYGGKGETKGTITFPRWTPMEWSFDIDVQGVKTNEALEAVFGRPSNFHGTINTTLHIDAVSTLTETFKGEGHLEILHPHFKGTSPLTKIQDFMKMGSLADAVFPKIEGDFTVQDSCVQTKKMSMGNELFQLAGKGKVWFDRRMDLYLYVEPLAGLGDSTILSVPDKVIGFLSQSLLKFHITGNAADPDIRPEPISMDKWNGLRLFHIDRKDKAPSESKAGSMPSTDKNIPEAARPKGNP